MPGSEGGDRVYNFFDQEKFSHQHSQDVDGSRLVSSGFHWPGNQRHESSPLNFSPGQSASDPDRGNLDRQSSLVHSSPFLQSPQRPTFIVSPHLMQHTSLNGYMHDHHLFQAKHDETDFMGMNRESNQHIPFSRGLLNSGAQYRNVPEQHQDARLDTTESPINFDFLGSHQQTNTQQLGMLQSSPRQHSGLNERQLLRQQAMLRNLYDVQRQQQLQTQDIRQMNSVNNLSIGQERPKDRSPSLNNTSFQDGSNYAWMSQHGAGNPDWLQGVASPVMLGTSNGISFSTEESAPPHIVGFSPQSVDHSLYGFPISNIRGSSSHHSYSMEKDMLSSQQVLRESIPVPANQYDTLLGQVSAQDREFRSRFGFQRNNNLTNASNQGSYNGTTMGNSSQAESQQRNHSTEFQAVQRVSSSSMNSKENTLSQTVILQDAAPLDPTEEQFLFGSNDNDNIWDAFGKSSNSKLDDYKTFEGSEFQNPFPSMQSGSWSALMQSALAETCSGDTGNQEEWSGLNLSGKPANAGHEPLAFSSSEKQRALVTNDNLHIEPSLDANQYLSLEKRGATNSHCMQGFPLSNLSSSSNVNERFQFNSAPKSNQQISEDDRRFDYINLKAHSEGNQIHSKPGHLPAAIQNLKGLPGAWDHRHGTSLNNIVSQAYNKSNHGTYMGSVPGDRSPVRSTSNEKIMHPRKDEQKRFMHEEIQKGKSAWTQNSFPNSPSPIGQLNSNSRVATDSTVNSLHDNLHVGQSTPVHDNHWKRVGSIPEVGNENMARSDNPPEARPHVLDSSVNSSENKIQASAPGDYTKHENYVHLQQSNFWDNTSRNRLKDTFMTGQSDPNVADQVAGNSPARRKCQSHSPGQGLKRSTQNDKGKGSNSHTNMYQLHETSSVGLSMHHLANKTFQSSQDMVELLNKTGQSKENSAETSRNSSEHNMLSEKLAVESPDTSMSYSQQNPFLGPQTYGLQLGLPHQIFPSQIPGSSHAPSLSLNPGHFVRHHPSAASQAELHGARSGVLEQSGDSVSRHKVQEHSCASISSGPPNLGNQFQNQQACEGNASSNPCMPADTMVSQLDHTDRMPTKAFVMQSSVGAQFNAMASNKNPVNVLSSSSQADKNIQSNVRPRQSSLHVGFPSTWTNVPEQQSSCQPDLFTSQSHMKTFAIPPIKNDEENPTIRGNYSPGSGAPTTTFTSRSSWEDQHAISSSWKNGVPDDTGLELKATNIPGKDGFIFSDTVTHPNCETSGSSVKSDVKPQKSYSLLHQLQVMRSTEIDPNNRDCKRLKVQSSSSDAQQSPSRFGQHQYSYSPTVTEIGKSNLALSGDSKLGKFISVPSINQGRIPLQHGRALFQNIPTFGQNDTQNSHSGTSAVSSTPLTQISPQMAPTWFERYGSFNRAQLVPASDVWKHSLSRPLELGQTPESSSTSFLAQNHVQQIPALFVANQGDTKHCSAPEHIVIEQSSSPQLTALTFPCLASVVPHKLETTTLRPWYIEVTQHGLQYLPNISASEVKWANATKRISEKAMEVVEQAEDRTINCKRLVLTIQLMQQLLDPPPASVMSSDAYKNYESVVYFTSRVSCGSSCSLSGSKSHCTVSSDHNDMIHKRVPEQGDALLSKVENDFLVRASMLESALSSLEKQTSILDLRMDWQDLEKFSVINRFAKFHGRGQADGSTIINSAMNSQSHGPQRYVTAFPSPRNLPDTVQCLSL